MSDFASSAILFSLSKAGLSYNYFQKTYHWVYLAEERSLSCTLRVRIILPQLINMCVRNILSQLTNLVHTIKQLCDKATSAVQMNGSMGEWLRTTVGVR